MTKNMDDFLNIPHEDELQEETSLTVAEPSGTEVSSLIKEDEHGKEADQIRKLALDLQDEIAEVARNVAPDRSARMFEVSGQHLKIALDASNSKIKAQLDAGKLKLDAAKVGVKSNMIDSLNSGTEIVADRNELIKELLSEEEGGVVDVDIEEES